MLNNFHKCIINHTRHKSCSMIFNFFFFFNHHHQTQFNSISRLFKLLSMYFPNDYVSITLRQYIKPDGSLFSIFFLFTRNKRPLSLSFENKLIYLTIFICFFLQVLTSIILRKFLIFFLSSLLLNDFDEKKDKLR